MTTFYNLDMIIALGYRVRSIIATRFRQWATQRLKEYITKGFTMDDERLKKLGGGGYWKELLERIRDIRATEKVFYRQVLEIYATVLTTTLAPQCHRNFSRSAKQDTLCYPRSHCRRIDSGTCRLRERLHGTTHL